MSAALQYYADNKGYNLEVFHVPTGDQVSIRAFLKSHTDTTDVKWNSDNVFGRPDAIHNWSSTGRRISVSFDIVGTDVFECLQNLSKFNRLYSYSYPAYTNSRSSTTISASPLVKVRYANLIHNGTQEPGGTVQDCGLVGAITGIKYQAIENLGYIDYIDNLIPKGITTAIEFTVLHTHKVGWENRVFANGETGINNFPFHVSEAFEVYSQNRAQGIANATERVVGAAAGSLAALQGPALPPGANLGARAAIRSAIENPRVNTPSTLEESLLSTSNSSTNSTAGEELRDIARRSERTRDGIQEITGE